MTVEINGEPSAKTIKIDKTPDDLGISARGSVPALLTWMTGRGSAGVSPPDVPPAPRWL